MNDSTLINRLKDVCPTPSQALKTFDFLRSVRAIGLSQARDTISRSHWYRFRNWLNAAGVSDAQLQDGAPLVRVALDPVRIYDFKVESDRLNLVQRAHELAVDNTVERLHQEVFKRSA